MVNIGKFIGQVRTEMGKVAWPSKDELVASTVVVLIATFILALYIGICDVAMSKILSILISGAIS